MTDLATKTDAVAAANQAHTNALAKVAALEEKFAEAPENEIVRRELHVARVQAGWKQFTIDTVSGAEPRLTIPWVAILEIRYAEDWSGTSKAPDSTWLRPTSKVMDGGRLSKTGAARLCTDGVWRRDVSVEHNVVAVEDLEHLCSIVGRMEDLVLYKADQTGLMRIQIFDTYQ